MHIQCARQPWRHAGVRRRGCTPQQPITPLPPSPPPSLPVPCPLCARPCAYERRLLAGARPCPGARPEGEAEPGAACTHSHAPPPAPSVQEPPQFAQDHQPLFLAEETVEEK